MTRSRGWARGWTLARAAAAALAICAIAAQAAVSIRGAASGGRDVATTVVNFFSFFTILSNSAAVVVLLWAIVWLWRGDRTTTDAAALRAPRALAFALTAVTSYMVVTGIVYNLLLRSIALPQGSTVAWSNEVLHVVMPLFLVADLIVGPGIRALRWRAVPEILVFPLVWVVYTLVRGPLTTDPSGAPPYWYPYPFLDPHRPGGYLEVAAYVAAIAVCIAIVAAGAVWVGRRRSLAAARAVPRSAGPGQRRRDR